jgi:predicted O-methyltransferase YrrM
MRDDLITRAWRSAAFRLHRLAGAAQGRLRTREFRRLGVREKVRSWTSPIELEALYTLATACPAGGCILEIGSYLGASTCRLAAGSARAGARIVCVDTWQNETMPEGERDTFQEFQENVRGALDRITLVRKRSADLLAADVGAPVHLAFLDADHSYEATKTDAAVVLPLMAPDGVVAFHDTAHFPGVSRALGEILGAGAWRLAGHADNLTWLRRAEWSPTE